MCLSIQNPISLYKKAAAAVVVVVAVAAAAVAVAVATSTITFATTASPPADVVQPVLLLSWKKPCTPFSPLSP